MVPKEHPLRRVTIPAAGYVAVQATTGIRALKDDFAICPSHIEVIKAKAPQAALVLNKFHIVRQLTDAVDMVSRQEVAEKDKENKSVLAGTRYIWLKNPWNLTDRQKAGLSFLETLNLKDLPGLSAQ